ncbi:DUF550 domain-containing protein [Klebsiella quasivariicola]|uniref:DUF550 domain-containing protein n=1 Tax=Klebsiella quasivariicola TaxID=2026240 RepID=UPI0035ABB2F1
MFSTADGELQERRKAESNSEPVAWLGIYHGEVYDDAIGITRSIVEAQAERFGWEPALTEITPLYRHAQPAPEREQVRREHAEWSQATFGDVGPVGPLKHLSKEALEAAADPHDPLEWADMQFLLWDAQRRMGISDEFITRAMVEKLAINKARQWPNPKDGEPRLHIKEQPALVVPDERAAFNDRRVAMRKRFEDKADALQAGNSPVIGIDPASGPDRAVEVRYVAPLGYVIVPMRLTAENGAKGALSGEFSETKFVNCPECFGDDECETCDGSGRIEITVPVTWTTIKDIWAKGVEHFAAAPQENN